MSLSISQIKLLKLNDRAGAARLKISLLNKSNASIYREIVLAASWTSDSPTNNKEKADEEAISTQSAEVNGKPETNKSKLDKSPEAIEKSELEANEKTNNTWRKPKNFKRPVSHKKATAGAKPLEQKQPNTNKNPEETKPKPSTVRLGQFDNWTEYA